MGEKYHISRPISCFIFRSISWISPLACRYLCATPCVPPLACHPLRATPWMPPPGCRPLDAAPWMPPPWMPPLATLLLRVELVVLRVVVVLFNDDVELSLICEHIANKEGTTITANRSCIARYCVQISALLIPRR